MRARVSPSGATATDWWTWAALALATLHGAALAIVHARPGLPALVLWYIEGERVRAGQMIGRVGNSGNSSEPHVHVQLQDTPASYLAEGIPFYFHSYRVSGVEIDRGMPYGGRERRSRRWPGGFTGQIVEHIGKDLST